MARRDYGVSRSSVDDLAEVLPRVRLKRVAFTRVAGAEVG